MGGWSRPRWASHTSVARPKCRGPARRCAFLGDMSLLLWRPRLKSCSRRTGSCRKSVQTWTSKFGGSGGSSETVCRWGVSRKMPCNPRRLWRSPWKEELDNWNSVFGSWRAVLVYSLGTWKGPRETRRISTDWPLVPRYLQCMDAHVHDALPHLLFFFSLFFFFFFIVGGGDWGGGEGGGG